MKICFPCHYNNNNKVCHWFKYTIVLYADKNNIKYPEQGIEPMDLILTREAVNNSMYTITYLAVQYSYSTGLYWFVLVCTNLQSIFTWVICHVYLENICLQYSFQFASDQSFREIFNELFFLGSRNKYAITLWRVTRLTRVKNILSRIIMKYQYTVYSCPRD